MKSFSREPLFSGEDVVEEDSRVDVEVVSVSVMDGLDWLLSKEVLVISSSSLSTSARGWKGLSLNLF